VYKLWIKNVELNGFRGLYGAVELSNGLNIIIGPNCSGKTAVIEALAHVLILNYTDLRITNGLLLILHAARGSERHSIASIAPSTSDTASSPTRVCVVNNEGVRACISIEKSTRIESHGTQLSPVVEVLLKASNRECSVKYTLGHRSIGIGIRGSECIKEKGLSIGVVTPGILPYNFFDALIGRIKRENPDIFRKLEINVSGKVFKPDIASDEWDMLSAYILESDGESRNISFYSIGRGLQRALLLLLQLELSNIILIDEIESAMHPELLEEVVYWIVNAVNSGKQVILTTQSLEAARVLVGAISGVEKSLWRRVHKLSTIIPRLCSSEEFSKQVRDKLSLIILRNIGGKLESLKMDGCSAIQYIIGTEDVRMSYTLIS